MLMIKGCFSIRLVLLLSLSCILASGSYDAGCVPKSGVWDTYTAVINLQTEPSVECGSRRSSARQFCSSFGIVHRADAQKYDCGTEAGALALRANGSAGFLLVGNA